MSAWTDQAVDRLKVLWAEGKSASQIMNALNGEFRGSGFSRSSVIGKVHRLGLTGRQTPSNPVGQALRAPPVARAPYQNAGLAFASRQRQPMPKGAMVLTPVVGGDVATAARVENMAARENPAENVLQMARAFVPLEGCAPVAFGAKGCKWPVSPEGADMLQCGQVRAEGVNGVQPYCEAHCRAAFQAVKKGQPKNGNELARALRKWAA